MEQPQKWNGLGIPPYSWNNLITQELLNIPDMGLDAAVGVTAQTLLSYVDEDSIKSYAERIMKNLKLTNRNADDAYKVLVSYWKELNPEFNENVKTVEMSTDKVVFNAGHNCQFCTNPALMLNNLEYYCNLRFKHNCFDNPVDYLLVKAVNPKLELKLEKFREERNQPCQYSITVNKDNN